MLTAAQNLTRRIRGNLVVMRHMPGQRKVPYLPPERWMALRDARVRSIVRHAAGSVPYYRELFRTLGIHPGDIRTAEDLDHIPLLDKETIWNDPDRFLSETRFGRHSLPLVTSGSASAPLRVRHDHQSVLANIAYGERERAVLERLCAKPGRWKELMLLYSGSTFGKVLDFYQHHTLIPRRPERRFVSLSEPVEVVVEAINDFQPDVITGYSGYLEMLFRTVAARSMKLYRPRLIIYGGEAMTSPGRDFISERFDVPLTSLYNAVESFKIGFACEYNQGYHLHADLCHLKLVDDQGRTVPDGERGEVVISNLVNRATVLLNYRLGDVAARSLDPCPCGRTLPMLKQLEGRLEDIITLPDGSFVHPLSIWGIFKNRPEVLRYQLIQHDARHFELRLVTLDLQTYESLLPAILEALRALLGPDAIISPAFYEELRHEGIGKFRAVVSTRKSRGQ